LQTYCEVLFTYNLHILQVKSESTYRYFFFTASGLRFIPPPFFKSPASFFNLQLHLFQIESLAFDSSDLLISDSSRP